MITEERHKKGVRLIVSVSVLVPLAVLFLLYFPEKIQLGLWVKALPHVIASINSSTAIILIAAFLAIRNKKINWHRQLMTIAIILGAIFLIAYVVYHASVPSTIFGDIDHNGILSPDEKTEIGNLRFLYLTLLITHILCSFIVLPIVLFSYYYGISNLIDKHKRLVKWSYPIWLFVSISGVFIYLMISPFYS